MQIELAPSVRPLTVEPPTGRLRTTGEMEPCIGPPEGGTWRLLGSTFAVGAQD